MSQPASRILAVDPGEKRIGLAISDPTRTIAQPLKVIKHVSRLIDAAAIAQEAVEQEAGLILVGQPLDSDGQVGPMARKSIRLAQVIQTQTNLQVVLWDETGSTTDARAVRLQSRTRRSQRGGHLDDLAAAIILQSYLDVHKNQHRDLISNGEG